MQVAGQGADGGGIGGVPLIVLDAAQLAHFHRHFERHGDVGTDPCWHIPDAACLLDEQLVLPLLHHPPRAALGDEHRHLAVVLQGGHEVLVEGADDPSRSYVPDEVGLLVGDHRDVVVEIVHPLAGAFEHAVVLQHHADGLQLLQGAVEVLPGEGAEGMGAAHQGVGGVALDAPGHGHGHDLVGEHRQGILPARVVLHYLGFAAAGDDHGLGDLVGVCGEDHGADFPPDAVTRPSGTLGHPRNLPRGVVLHHQVGAADIDTELQRRGADQRFQMLVLEGILGLHPDLFGE